jgi:RNA polymerase-binding transcription factor DksA
LLGGKQRLVDLFRKKIGRKDGKMTTGIITNTERRKACCDALNVAIKNLRDSRNQEAMDQVSNHLDPETFAMLQMEHFQRDLSNNVLMEDSISKRKQKILSGNDDCVCNHCGIEISLEYLRLRPLTPICQNCEKAAGVEGIGLRITTPKVPRKR